MTSRKSPAGLLGTSYAFSHDRGIYRSCGVTGVYQIPSRFSIKSDFEDIFKHALAKTIDRHPELCYGVFDKSKDEDAHLYRLSELKWNDIVQTQDTDSGNDDDDSILDDIVGPVHDTLFSDQRNRPAWKLFVLRHNNKPTSGSTRIDIVFVCHHAISDGSSCLAFQKTLQRHLYEESLSTPKDTGNRWPYLVPNDIPTPVFLEDKFPLTKYLELPPAPHQPSPALDPWTANPPSLPTIDSMRTKLTSIFIPFSQVTTVLNYCRQRKITLTGLLHALITSHLSKSVPHAQTFRGSTPMSMRAFTHTGKDEIVNHVTGIVSDWSPEHVSILRRSEENSAEEESSIIAIAQTFQEQVRAELQGMLEHGSAGLLDAARSTDYEALLEQALKAPKRGKTYELSNVGLLKVRADGEGARREDAIRLEKLVFTQSASVTGVAIACDVVSIEEGPLSITLAWQEGIVPDDIVHGMRDFLQRRLSDISTT